MMQQLNSCSGHAFLLGESFAAGFISDGLVCDSVLLGPNNAMKRNIFAQGTEDASKILSNDGACPICDQVLSKGHMKPVDINPSEDWVNILLLLADVHGRGITANVYPQPEKCLVKLVCTVHWPMFCLSLASPVMKSAYRSVMFYNGQRELELQCKINRIIAQCRQKCETMQEKFSEKLGQVHTAYQKMTKRCQMMEQEIENLAKDKQELQEKFAAKSRQKRKLDEMYDQLKSECESIKRSAIQPASNFYSRAEPDLFSNPTNLLDNQDIGRKGPREGIWPVRRNSSNSGGPFDISTGSPAKRPAVPVDPGGRRPGAHSSFGGGVSNPSMTLRNLVLSPIKRPQLSCNNRPHLFT
ncbi:hypothetical protein Cgig2_009352 [Carnegiea gigantea]|uniref:E3 ubiquitin-protein ligase CCNB1IP1 homolog n=1 Tax=Carnegiea gigantea TaxID=171969 RepID=A0A9Q1GQT8_9CARY|nr:hypothetical protein Cgig2_009352 [Carnegiea gigantea]